MALRLLLPLTLGVASAKSTISSDGNDLFIDAPKMGIGVDPVKQLHVFGSGTSDLLLGGAVASGLEIGQDPGVQATSYIWQHAAHSLKFATSGTQRMIITAQGLVGIATSPNEVLSGAGLTVNAPVKATDLIAYGSDGITLQTSDGNKRLTVQGSNGYVGIGATSPSDRLQVGYGSSEYISVGNSGATDDPSGLKWRYGQSGVEYNKIVSAESAPGQTYTAFHTTKSPSMNVERMRITPHGEILGNADDEGGWRSGSGTAAGTTLAPCCGSMYTINANGRTNNAGAWMLSIYDRVSGEGAVVFITYKSYPKIIVGDDLIMVAGETTCGGARGKICVVSASNDHTVYVTNRIDGSSKTVDIAVYAASL